MITPMPSGNQPPWKILVRLAARKVRSIVRKTAANATAIHRGFFQSERRTTMNSSASIVIVPTTATP